MSLGKIIDNLQKSWDNARSYEASFTQKVISKSLGGDPDKSQGTLSVIKPGRLRWQADDGNIEILNKVKLVSIQPNPNKSSREVDIWKNAAQALDAKLLNFLSGKAEFKRLYHVSLHSETDKSAELKLISKTDADETYLAEIDKESYLLRSLTIDSVESRTIINFSDIHINIALKDDLFVYDKRPTDIVHEH